MNDKNCEKCDILMLQVFPFQKYCSTCKLVAEKERKQRHYQRNKEEYNERGKEYNKVNKERISAQRKEARLRNLDVVREKDRIRYTKEKERRKAYKKAYDIANKDAILAKEAKRYQEKKEHIKAYTKEYNKKNPDKVREWSRIKRVRKKNSFGTHKVAEFYALCERFDWECAYCNTSVDKKTVTVDHFIPTSKGGSDLIENIVPSCRSCNSSKQSQDFFEWYKGKEFYTLENEIRILNRNGKPQLTLF